MSQNLIFICFIQVLCTLSFSTSAHTGEDPNQVYPYEINMMMISVYDSALPLGQPRVISQDIWFCSPGSICKCTSGVNSCNGRYFSTAYGRDHCLSVHGLPKKDSDGNPSVWHGVSSSVDWVGHGYSRSVYCQSITALGKITKTIGSYYSGGVLINPRANRIASCKSNSVLIEGACESKNSAKVRKSLGTPSDCLKAGNPCDASTGNKFQTEVDFTSSTLNFIRYYNSLLNTNGIVGNNWSHNYSSRLIITTDTVLVQSGSGKGLTFEYPTEGYATSDSDVFSQLFKKTDGSWEYRRTDNTIEIYNTVGQLITIRTLNGLETQLSYYSDGHLKNVTDAFGQLLSFSYNTEGKIDTVTTPAEEVIQYSYNGPRLETVTYPDGTSRQYLYKNNKAAQMNGIIDETGHPYARWDYDNQGRAILSEHID